jgi:hypothetical protein
VLTTVPIISSLVESIPAATTNSTPGGPITSGSIPPSAPGQVTSPDQVSSPSTVVRIPVSNIPAVPQTYAPVSNTVALPATYTPARHAATQHATLVAAAIEVSSPHATTLTALPHTGGGAGGVPSTPGLPFLPIAIALWLIGLGTLGRKVVL